MELRVVSSHSPRLVKTQALSDMDNVEVQLLVSLRDLLHSGLGRAVQPPDLPDDYRDPKSSAPTFLLRHPTRVSIAPDLRAIHRSALAPAPEGSG